MDDSFLAALFPGKHRVLGFRLEPFCRGHLASLYAIASPLLAAPGGGAQVTAGDLLAALCICSRPGWPLLSPEDVRPRWRDVLTRWWAGRNGERLRVAIEAFDEYRDAHCSFPTFYTDDSKANLDIPEDIPTDAPLTAPAVLVQVCSLISRTTITWEQAWRLPLAVPSWIIGTLSEAEGGPTRFLYESDEATDDMPEDVATLSEKELYRGAVERLGPKKAKEWQKARRKTLRAWKRRAKKAAGSAFSDPSKQERDNAQEKGQAEKS